MDVAEMTDAVDSALRVDDVLGGDGYEVTSLDLSEVYVRTPEGTVFRLDVHRLSAEEFQASGVDFD